MLELSAREMARLIREKRVSSRELVGAHLHQIEKTTPLLNAVVEVFAEEAMLAAAKADQQTWHGGHLGALHGIPFSVKDSLDVSGYRTTAGTVGLRACAPAKEDATLVNRMRIAGGIPLCKTNLPDLLFAFESDNLLFGRSNNPYDLDRTPGGSSGGESALIAACGSPIGLGSDAAGSVRIPASFCGITSIKPTSGRLPRTGHVPGPGGWIEALWQVGPMARHVEDLQLAMELLAGSDGRDFTSPSVPLDEPESLEDLRVAFFTDNGIVACTQPVREAVESAAEALRLAGLRVEEKRPPGVDRAFDLEMALLGADGGDGIDAYLRAVGSDKQHPLLHAGFLDRIRELRCSLTQFADLWARWDQYRREISAFFTEFDVVLSPAYIEPALSHGESVLPGKFEGFSYTMAWNVSGNPAAVVRCSEAAGLPINVQVITPKWKEQRALRICSLLESHFGGWHRPGAFS